MALWVGYDTPNRRYLDTKEHVDVTQAYLYLSIHSLVLLAGSSVKRVSGLHIIANYF